ncbi:MAG: hypothetical protein ACO1PW_10160 [Actinomycetota bacterium]
MTDAHQDGDPGWSSSKSLLTILVPWVGLRRAQHEGAGALEVLRQAFTAFVAALVLIGVVVLVLASGVSDEDAMSPGLVAAGVAGFGVISLFLPRLFERPLDCTDAGTLLVGYRTRFFLRLAFAAAAALVGFVGVFLAATWWLYPLGAAFAAIGFARLAPTQANLQRDQDELNLSGCGRSLVHVLTSSSG